MARTKRFGMVFGGVVAVAVVLMFAGTASATPTFATGCVYCDANGNQVVDPSDTPLPGVGVNVSRGGVYPDSLDGATGADGCFSITLLWPYSSWTEILDAATLPADAIFIDPNSNSHLFTLVEDPPYTTDTRNWLIGSATCRSHFCGDGVVDPGEGCDDGNNADGDGCSANCTREQRGGGCTPGYWKQAQHFDSWVFYTPGTMFSAVFENAFPGMTLLQVMNLGGGGLNALGRHAVAGLLNAQNTDVQYGLSAPEVIGLFNNTFPGTKPAYNQAKDLLETNNQTFCPLN